jgi:DNA-binding NarL/FixJ family response regulator
MRVTFVGRRVLVVEDDFLVSLTTGDFLERLGCEVVGPAARIAAAVRLAQSELLDAAVLDINIAGDMVWPVAEELWCKIARNFDPTLKAAYVIVNAGQYWNLRGSVSRPTVTPQNSMIMQ